MMRLHPQGSPGTPLAARFSKMLWTYYQYTWYHIPTDFNLQQQQQQHCKQKKKPQIMQSILDKMKNIWRKEAKKIFRPWQCCIYRCYLQWNLWSSLFTS